MKPAAPLPIRFRKLTPEEKKRVWARPESNAGAGWHTNGDDRERQRIRREREREHEPLVEIIRDGREIFSL